MTRLLKNRYPGPGGMLAVSLGLHLAVFALILWGHLLPDLHPAQTPVTYVDMVTLPVANPQSGTPAPATGTASQPPTAVAPTPKQVMTLPAAKPKQITKTAPAVKQKAAQTPPSKQKSEKQAADEDQRAFEKRMSKLEQQADDRRMSDVLAKTKSRAGSRTGMPGGKGTQAGSDYTSYVRSRIQDAIDTYGASTNSKSPKILLSITIGPDGRIDFSVESKSDDSSYNAAVTRAIKSMKSLKPPPGGGQFKCEFLFKYTGKGVAVQ